jgi:hypothetical protein
MRSHSLGSISPMFFLVFCFLLFFLNIIYFCVGGETFAGLSRTPRSGSRRATTDGSNNPETILNEALAAKSPRGK